MATEHGATDVEGPIPVKVRRPGGIRLSVLVGLAVVLAVVSMNFQTLFPTHGAVEQELLRFMGEVNHGEGVGVVDKVIAEGKFKLIDKMEVEYDAGSKTNGRLAVGATPHWWTGKSDEDLPRAYLTFVGGKIEAITMTY